MVAGALLSDISIPELLAKVLLPTIRKGGQLRGAAKKVLVLGIDRIKIHDIRNRQRAFLPIHKINEIAPSDFSFSNHCDGEPLALALKKSLDHVHLIKSNAYFETRHSRSPYAE